MKCHEWNKYFVQYQTEDYLQSGKKKHSANRALLVQVNLESALKRLPKSHNIFTVVTVTWWGTNPNKHCPWLHCCMKEVHISQLSDIWIFFKWKRTLQVYYTKCQHFEVNRFFVLEKYKYLQKDAHAHRPRNGQKKDPCMYRPKNLHERTPQMQALNCTKNRSRLTVLSLFQFEVTWDNLVLLSLTFAPAKRATELVLVSIFAFVSGKLCSVWRGIICKWRNCLRLLFLNEMVIDFAVYSGSIARGLVGL